MTDALQDVLVDLTGPQEDDDVILHSASMGPSKRQRSSVAGRSSLLTQQIAANAAAEVKQKQAEAESRRPQCSVCMDDIKDMMCPPCG